MSENTTGDTPAAGSGGTNAPPSAGNDFARYQSRQGAPSGLVLGWAMPPSFAQMPRMQMPPMQGGPAPAPGAGMAGSLTDSLGTTVQLGVNLLNALLSSSANALSGVTAMAQQGAGRLYASGWQGGHGGGCGCDSCGGQDCCAPQPCSCCRPSVNGCC